MEDRITIIFLIQENLFTLTLKNKVYDAWNIKSALVSLNIYPTDPMMKLSCSLGSSLLASLM